MLQLHFEPFPILLTERLVLRQLTPKDAAEIFFLRTDEAVNKFIDRPKCTGIADAGSFIQNINDGIANGECFYWAISLKNEPKLIGTICFWNIIEEKQCAEIGYELNPDFQGKGIMQEAIQKIIQFGFENIQLKMIIAMTHRAHEKSIRLLKQHNFVRSDKAEAVTLPNLSNYSIFILKKTIGTVRI